MKNLKDYIKEGILDNIDTALKNADDIINNPFLECWNMWIKNNKNTRNMNISKIYDAFQKLKLPKYSDISTIDIKINKYIRNYIMFDIQGKFNKNNKYRLFDLSFYDDKNCKVTIEFPSYYLDITNSYGSEENRIEYCKSLEKLYALKPSDNYNYLNLK